MRHFAVGITLALLVGCSPSPTPTPTPVPTYQCTPEAGGTPAPCSAAAYEEMKKKDALYAEAESLYRRYVAEEIRIDQAGGAKEATDEFKAVLSGWLLDQTVKVHRQNLLDGITVKGTQKLVWVQRRPGVAREDSVVALAGCRDASGVKSYQLGKYIGQGLTAIETAFAHVEGGRLSLFRVTTDEVTSCS